MRDTDADWNQIGRDEPFYGVFVSDRYLRKNLDEAALAAFWASGVADIDQALKMIRHHFGAFTPQSAIDFGCGVGRLTRAMAGLCPEVTGVDISEGMLAEAEKYAVGNMRLRRDIPEVSVDWVQSSIVFQHIPPDRGYDLFDQLLKRLNSRGVFSIHITIFKDSRYLSRLGDLFDKGSWDGSALKYINLNPSPIGTMLMYDYELTKLFMICVSNDIHDFYFNHTDHNGCHGIMLYGRRS